MAFSEGIKSQLSLEKKDCTPTEGKVVVYNSNKRLIRKGLHE